MTTFGEMRDRRFAEVGCRQPVRMGHDLACEARFLRATPDWKAVLRIVDSTLVADSLAERAETKARQPRITADGSVRIRGQADGGGVYAEIRDGGVRRGWRVGADSVLARLVDSLVARAADGRR
jgi:hypothetical protein